MAYKNILAALLLFGMLLPFSAEASFYGSPEAPSDDGAKPATIATTAAVHGIPMPFSAAPDTVKPEIIPIACELQCPDFELDWIVVRANCGQADGKAEVIPVGFPAGTTFGYSWPDGISNTATAEGLSPGVYTVTVTTGQTDNPWYQDCFITTDVIVETVDGPELQAEVKKSTNCAEQNGKAELTVTGGTPPYTIEWSGLSTTLNAEGTTTLNNLMPGSNKVVVTDGAGCVSVIDIDVFEDEGGFGIIVDTEGPSDCGATDGSITVNIFGGVSPYTITLNDNPGTTVTTSASSYTFSDLFSGTFTVEVEDAWRCEEADTVALSAIDCLPGPWTVTDPACPGGEGIIEFLGTGPAHERYEVRQINSADLLGEANGDQTLLLQLEPGNYVVRRLSTQDDCICTFQFTIDDPDPLHVQVEVRDAVCEPSGITAGSISVPYVKGGTPPYQVFVNDTINLQVGQLLPNLNPGSYSVKVRDANGCSIPKTTVEVEGDSILTGGTQLVQEVCPDSLIQVELQPSVIEDNLDYQWSPANNLDDAASPTPTATISAPATYFVTITDGACIALEDTIRLEILPEIELAVAGDTLLCGVESTTITANSSANVQVDSIRWFQNGQLADDDNDNNFELFATESSSEFYVVAQTIQGCTDTVFFQPTLIGEEIAIAAFPEDTTVCRGEPVTLSAVVAPDLPTTTLNWFLLGEQANSLGQQDSIQVSPDNTSQYVIEAVGLCNTVYDTVAVNIIEDDFTVDITTGADTICLGDSTMLTAGITPDSISADIEWTQGGSTVGSGSEITATPGAAGSYTYIATGSNECQTASDSVTVVVLDSIQVDAQPDTTVVLCTPEEVCFTADAAGLPVIWLDSAGDTLAFGAQLCVTPPAGASQYTATAGGQCVLPDVVNVEVTPDSFDIDVTASADTICVGDSTVLTADILPGSVSATITWTLDGNTIGSGSEISATPSAPGSYTYVATGMNACGMASDSVTVEVQDSFDIDVTASADTICVGDSTVLTADILPDSVSATITWTLEGNTVGSGSEITATPGAPGSYTYVATGMNACGTASDSVAIEVLGNLIVDAQPDTTIELCAPVEEEICLTATADGQPIIWLNSAGDTLGTGPELCVIPPLGTSEYIATADYVCEVTPDTVRVEVQDSFSLDVTASADTICVGDNSTLEAAIIPESVSAAITWTQGGIEVGTGSSIAVTPSAPGSYTYVATGMNTCGMASDSVTIVVLGNIAVDAQTDTTLCTGEGTTLTVQVSPVGADAGLVWTLDGVEVGNGNELPISLDSTGVYVYVATATGPCNTASDAVTITVIDSVQIDAQPDTAILRCAPVQEEVCLSATAEGLEEDILWVNANGDSLGTGGELCVIPPIGESLYIATLPDYNCAIADTVQVLVDTMPPPPPVFADSTKICLGDTAVVDVSDDYPYPFVWLDESGGIVAENEDLMVSPDTTGSFEYILQASNECGTVQDTAVITVVDSSAVEIVGGSMTFCTVDTAVLTANWTFPECVVWTDIEGTPLDTGAQIVILPTAGTDTIIAQLPGLDCVVPDTVTISFLPPPTVDITLTNDVICEGDTAVLTAEVLPPSSTNFVSWYDTDFNFLTDGTTLEVSPEAGGYTYIAVAENACGIDTAFVNLRVERLDLELVVTNDTICPDESATLEVVGCEDCTYAWMPEDGLSAPDSAITVAEPTGTTTYTVEVSGQACVEELAATITVIDCPECMEMVFVADAFTPNGDGNNDSVCLRSNFLEDFEEVEFMIYNRWGEELFHSTDIKNMCWDGKHRNKQLPPDVYGYFLRVKCPGRDAVEIKGNITLLR